MAILGISLIAGVSGDSLPKGIMSGLLGILMAYHRGGCSYRCHAFYVWH